MSVPKIEDVVGEFSGIESTTKATLILESNLSFKSTCDGSYGPQQSKGTYSIGAGILIAQIEEVEDKITEHWPYQMGPDGRVIRIFQGVAGLIRTK